MPDPAADAAPPGADSPTTFTLYRHGPVTVIGWSGAAEVDADPADFQREAAGLVAGADASALAVDLTGLERYPPGLLGGLTALAEGGLRVLLFNPTEEVGEVLRAAGLADRLELHAADLDA